MANALNLDVTGKKVMLVNKRPFLCEGGFGCKPYLSGTFIAGTYLDTNEESAIRGDDIVRLLNPEEE